MARLFLQILAETNGLAFQSLLHGLGHNGKKTVQNLPEKNTKKHKKDKVLFGALCSTI